MLKATLPHVGTWNTWYDWYGNSVDGFAALNATIEARVRRSACVLVSVDGGAGERPHDPAAPAIASTALAEHLRGLRAAGADEAILVLDPITAESVAAAAAVLRAV
jgi:hypothetical protein